MISIKYTKEDKKLYFQQLRKRWKDSKEMADTDEKAKAIWRESAGKFSYYSFYFTLMSMKAQHLEGLPYIDCKTYDGWKKSGFQVKKDEHHKIEGITWLHPKYKTNNGEEEEDEGYSYPKMYNLFHKSQVEAI